MANKEGKKSFDLKNLNKKQKIALFAIAGVLVLVLIVGIIFSLTGNNEEPPGELKGENIQEVSPETAEGMYSSLTENCSGAFVWDMQAGESIEINDLKNTSTCKKQDHYSKMVGFSYDEIGVSVYVNVLKAVNGELQNLDGVVIGAYDEATLQDMLDKGTTFVYSFKKVGEKYELAQVKKMEVDNPEPAEPVYE